MEGSEKLIQHCFDEHKKDFNDNIKFDFAQYEKFWKEHQIGDEYKMVNRDKSYVICKVAYYPLPTYPDLRALIEIKIEDGIDYREVPIHFLEKLNK